MNGKVLIAGGGGFIGGNLVARLREHGFDDIRCVDRKPLEAWDQRHEGVENRVLDLRRVGDCREAVEGVTSVYNLAAETGGAGFLGSRQASRMLDVVINAHLLEAARDSGSVERLFFASSASVYPDQGTEEERWMGGLGCREEEAYPAMPEDGDGWEKLFSERMCRQFGEEFGLQTRVARLHGVYGPRGAWDGGREKAPAAICRKVAEAVVSGHREIEIWGDGEQARSFTFIDDCTTGMVSIMGGRIPEPLNLGCAETVSINGLVDVVEEIAGVRLERRHRLDAPCGVRRRGSDNALIRSYLGWEPSTPLRVGLEATYRWIFDQVSQRSGAGGPRRPLKRLPAILRAAS